MIECVCVCVPVLILMLLLACLLHLEYDIPLVTRTLFGTFLPFCGINHVPNILFVSATNFWLSDHQSQLPQERTQGNVKITGNLKWCEKKVYQESVRIACPKSAQCINIVVCMMIVSKILTAAAFHRTNNLKSWDDNEEHDKFLGEFFQCGADR